MTAFEETRQVMDNGDTVAVRTPDYYGTLLKIDDEGVAEIKPINGESELPVPLGEADDFELVQGRSGEYVLRQKGTGREKAGPTTLTLRHEFSREEMDELAEEMDQAMASKREVERELDSLQQAVKERKAAIEGLVNSVALLSSKRREGFEMRPFKCVMVKDFDKGLMETINPDTGEIVKSRYLNNDELQVSMPFEADEQEAAA